MFSMFDETTFNSRDSTYKTPYGAVMSGSRVRFTIRPPRRWGHSRAWLQARLEFDNNRVVRVPMPWAGTDLGRDSYTGEWNTAGYIGLAWYSFLLEGIDGRTTQSQEYQLTIYDGSEEVPTWFGEGVCYQIFPDRFRRTAIPDPKGMVGGRRVHAGWQDQPDYLPDAQGKVRNRDFFGGSLAGILEKLDYLKGLGVETIYLCPIFEAAENHRYGTADYRRIDPMLGTEEDFSALCDAAHQRGMHVILDGVFNHTGFVSRYFNGDGFYPDPGAYQSKDSPYYSWFNFSRWPEEYDSWWGIRTLPALNEHDPSYRRFIFGGQDSVVRHWLRCGADGWRLDVADELPDDFVAGIHQAVRQAKNDAIVIGEVWEDGSTKVAYGVRRKHLLGGHCDGLMNYPFRNALVDYLLGMDAGSFRDQMETLRENYPHFAYYSAMNSLGTHDTLRILTLLGVGDPCLDRDKSWRAAYCMTAKQRRKGKRLLKVGAAILYCFPGSPTVYYGDEAGMEGFEDPFNRGGFPWGQEDRELVKYFTALGALRRDCPALRRGDIGYLAAEGRVLAFTRALEEQRVLCAANAGEDEFRLALPAGAKLTSLLGACTVEELEEGDALVLPPQSAVIAKVL